MTPPALAPEAPSVLAPAVYLCHCLKVTPDAVEEAIDYHDCHSVAEVTAVCGAGGGCTGCHTKIREYLARRRNELNRRGAESAESSQRTGIFDHAAMQQRIFVSMRFSLEAQDSRSNVRQ